MSLPRIVHHEYMPSSKSMPAQIYDVKEVIRRKYVETAKKENANLWGKVLAVEHPIRLRTLAKMEGVHD